jgi:hypothetical protein
MNVTVQHLQNLLSSSYPQIIDVAVEVGFNVFVMRVRDETIGWYLLVGEGYLW